MGDARAARDVSPRKSEYYSSALSFFALSRFRRLEEYDPRMTDSFLCRFVGKM